MHALSLTDLRRAAQRDGIWAWDSTLQEAVLVIPWVLALLGDNPMQSEFACHMGMQAKLFCRNCWVKGRDAKQESEKPRSGGGQGDEESDGMSADGGSGEESDESGSDSSACSAETSEKARKKTKNVAESMSNMLERVKSFVKVTYSR